MAVTSDDYLDLVNAVIECIQLKEQQESDRLIKEKLEVLNSALFESNLKKQKKLTEIIFKLKFLEKKLKNKAALVDPMLKETWELMASTVGKQIIEVSNQKKINARLQ